MEDIYFFYIAIMTLMLISIKASISQLRGEIRRLDSKVDRISNHVGVPEIKVEDIEFNNLIAEGKKIEAIKRYRQLTGLGLKESKEFVDSLIKQLKNKL